MMGAACTGPVELLVQLTTEQWVGQQGHEGPPAFRRGSNAPEGEKTPTWGQLESRGGEEAQTPLLSHKEPNYGGTTGKGIWGCGQGGPA